MSQKVYIRDVIEKLQCLKTDYLFELIEINELIRLYEKKMQEVGNIKIDSEMPKEWMT